MKISDLYSANGICILSDGEYDIFGVLSTVEGTKKVFSYIKSDKYLKELKNESLSCIICTEKLVKYLPQHIKGIIVSDNPERTFWSLFGKYANENRKHKKTLIGDQCIVSKSAYISSENVVIGNNVLIEEFVSVKEGTIIGDNCIIRAGSVIGGEGLQVQDNLDGTYLTVKHFGGTILGDNVEIQQNVCVSKGVLDYKNTIIGYGTKVGNNVVIAHEDYIGENCRIAAGTTIGGDTRIGNDVWIGLGAVVSNSLTIGDKAYISIGSVVVNNVPAHTKVFGHPARKFTL